MLSSIAIAAAAAETEGRQLNVSESFTEAAGCPFPLTKSSHMVRVSAVPVSDTRGNVEGCKPYGNSFSPTNEVALLYTSVAAVGVLGGARSKC